MNFPRTLVIGIDGATFDLIKPWADAGLLPTFAHLLKHGAHATLDAYPYLNSAAAWSNIVTGYNPGQHSVFSFTAQVHSPQEWYLVTARDRRKPAFWHTLAASGQRVGVMNVPISFPAETINGFMLSGMDAPLATSKGFSQPAQLFQELRGARIAYEIDVPNMGRAARANPNEMPASVRAMTVARTRAFLYLLEKYPCDAAMVVYIGFDRMAHYFWRDTPPLPDAREWKPLRDLLQLYDEQVSEVLSHAAHDTTVFLISDHGFGTMHIGNRGINQLLEKLGYQAPASRAAKTPLLGRWLDLGRRTIPQAWQRDLAMRFPKLHQRAAGGERVGGYAWSQTRAYAPYASGSIRINLRRRSALGIVEDADYEALVNELAEIVSALVDPETDAPLVKGTHRPQDFFRGPFADSAGDLFIRWDREQVRDAFAYRRNGHDFVITPPPHTNKWIGAHRPNGIFMAYGKGIRAGVAHDPISHFELTPTILYLHDQPLPDDLDGRVLTDWFENDFAAQRAIQKTTASAYTPNADALNDADDKLIQDRLRNLGYIE